MNETCFNIQKMSVIIEFHKNDRKCLDESSEDLIKIMFKKHLVLCDVS